MTPEQLARLLTGLARAAEVVECLEDHDLQLHRGWNLANWHYHLVPWGVRFSYEPPLHDGRSDVLVLTGLDGTRVVVEARPQLAETA